VKKEKNVKNGVFHSNAGTIDIGQESQCPQMLMLKFFFI